jgi:hypothetical protein
LLFSLIFKYLISVKMLTYKSCIIGAANRYIDDIFIAGTNDTNDDDEVEEDKLVAD